MTWDGAGGRHGQQDRGRPWDSLVSTGPPLLFFPTPSLPPQNAFLSNRTTARRLPLTLQTNASPPPSPSPVSPHVLWTSKGVSHAALNRVPRSPPLYRGRVVGCCWTRNMSRGGQGGGGGGGGGGGRWLQAGAPSLQLPTSIQMQKHCFAVPWPFLMPQLFGIPSLPSSIPSSHSSVDMDMVGRRGRRSTLQNSAHFAGLRRAPPASTISRAHQPVHARRPGRHSPPPAFRGCGAAAALHRPPCRHGLALPPALQTPWTTLQHLLPAPAAALMAGWRGGTTPVAVCWWLPVPTLYLLLAGRLPCAKPPSDVTRLPVSSYTTIFWFGEGG